MLIWGLTWILAGLCATLAYMIVRDATANAKRLKERRALLDDLANPLPPLPAPLGVVSVWVGPGIIEAGPDAFIEHERDRGHLS